MVKAIFRTPTDEAIEMRVLGHAGWAEMWKDPVCAGASVLAATCVQCVDAMRDRLQKKPTINVRSGNVRVVAKPKPEYYADLTQVFAVVQVGFALLAETYPENVAVEPFENSIGGHTEPDAGSIDKESST